MLGIARIRGPLIMATLPLQKYDINMKSPDGSTETPMDRIKKLFVSTDLEPITKELRTLRTFTITASVVGMIVGGVIHTQGTIQKFVDTNQATRFYSHYDAQRQAHLSFVLQFFKGGFKFGWRTALFTTVFGSIQLLLTTYYGEPSVWHYVAGGGTAGLLFKMSLGIRGSLIGLIVGSVLGGIGGSLSLLILKLTGCSLEDLHNMEQQWAYKKDEQYNAMIAKNLSEELKQAKLLYDENKKIQMQLSMEEKLIKEEQLTKEEKLSKEQTEKAKN